MNRTVVYVTGGIILVGLIVGGLMLSRDEGTTDAMPTPTSTATDTATSQPSDTPTPTDTVTSTATATGTAMPAPTNTATPTATSTTIPLTDTLMPTATFTFTPETAVLTVGLACGYRDFADIDGNGWYSPDGGDYYIGEAYGTESCIVGGGSEGNETDNSNSPPTECPPWGCEVTP